MKTLDKYILTEFLRIFMMSLVVMVMFYEMVTFIDTAGYFFKFQATFDMIFRFMLFKIPMAFFHVTPICVLMASVLTIVGLSRSSEIVAMKAAGFSLFRIAVPIILTSAAISFVAFLDSEYLFHLAAKETKRIYYDEIKKQPRKALFSKDRFWYKGDDGSIWNIGSALTQEKVINDVSIFYFDESGARITKRVSAVRGEYVDGKWTLKDYVEREFTSGGGFVERKFPKKTLIRAIPLAELKKVKLDPEEMNLDQMRRYIQDIKSKGYDATRYVVDMHAKMGFPLISLVMPLFAIPMGMRSSRAGGIMWGIGVAVIIGVAFWFSFSMGLAFGRAGRLPPLLSAYGAHMLFGFSGMYMLMTDRQ